jgi:chromosome partitioning protein
MASLRGLGWPEDTGLRAPVRAPGRDPVSALAAPATRGPAADGLPGPAGDVREPAGVARGSGAVGGAPALTRRLGSLGWPLTAHVSRETSANHHARSAHGEQSAGGGQSAGAGRSAAGEQPAGNDRAERSWPGLGNRASAANSSGTAPDPVRPAGGMAAYPAPAASRPARPGTSGLSADTPIARAAEVALEVRSGGGRPWPRPRACRIMTIANQKGGVGKTTTAVNIAAALALHGSNVLVIDLDPQGNASTALDVDHRVGTPSVYNVLIEDRPLAEIIRPVEGLPRLQCVPATIDLAGAEIELVPLVARESRLARAIAACDVSGLDYIIIDCPPSLGLLTVNSLVAASEVLIPIQCEYYALEGLEQLLRTVELVEGHLNADLVVSTILLTMYDARTRLAAQVADDVRSHFGAVVLGAVIPRSVRVSEAPSYGQSVMTYDPGSTGALAYLEAAKEIANQNLLTGPVPG